MILKPELPSVLTTLRGDKPNIPRRGFSLERDTICLIRWLTFLNVIFYHRQVLGRRCHLGTFLGFLWSQESSFPLRDTGLTLHTSCTESQNLLVFTIIVSYEGDGVYSCWEDIPPIKGAELSDRKQRGADPTHLAPGAASSPLWPLLRGAKPLPAWPWHPSTSAGLGYWLCQNSAFPGQDRGRRTFHLVRSPSMGTLFTTEHSKVTLASMDMCYTETRF